MKAEGVYILDLLKVLRKSKRHGMGPPCTIPKPELLGHFEVTQLQSPPFGEFPTGVWSV